MIVGWPGLPPHHEAALPIVKLGGRRYAKRVRGAVQGRSRRRSSDRLPTRLVHHLERLFPGAVRRRCEDEGHASQTRSNGADHQGQRRQNIAIERHADVSQAGGRHRFRPSTRRSKAHIRIPKAVKRKGLNPGIRVKIDAHGDDRFGGFPPFGDRDAMARMRKKRSFADRAATGANRSNAVI